MTSSTKRLRAWWRRTAPADRPVDAGSGLVLVLGLMTVLAVFVSASLTYAVQTLDTTTRDRDYQAAFAAAQAGLDDYVARLNNNETYWTTVDCTNPALKGPATGTNTCGWGSSTALGWRTVPGAASVVAERRPSYHYDVDATSTRANGAIRIVSTGKVGDMTRSLSVTMRRAGFTEYLYYTVYETIDPANTSVYANTAEAQTKCERYNWGPSPRDTTYCPAISFGSADIIRGPLHSNDTLVMQGTPRFQGAVTTSRSTCVAGNRTSCYQVSGSASPTFTSIGPGDAIELPTSLGDLKQYVDTGRSNPGCLYSGATRIKLLAGTSPPQMRVWSKSSAAPGTRPGCGSIADLHSATGALVAVPPANLIYVEDVPSARTVTDCTVAGAIGDSLPLANDYFMTVPEANCRFGTAYVEGQLSGRLTITTDNNVMITGDLTYAGAKTGTDALGLVAKNGVKVYHPVRCTTTNTRGVCTEGTNLRSPRTQTIYAAILTLQHSFTVDGYDLGAPLGTLTVYGTIAQRYRGPVALTSGGTIRNGYAKDYTFDTRLRFAPPPFFLDPVQSNWRTRAFNELTPRYRP